MYVKFEGESTACTLMARKSDTEQDKSDVQIAVCMESVFLIKLPNFNR